MSSYLSRDESTEIKGVFTLVVLAHHIRSLIPELNGTIVGSVLTIAGYLSVSVFLFLSGYGLMQKAIIDDQYIRKVLPKNTGRLYFRYTLVIGLNLFFLSFSKEKTILSKILQTFFWGNTIIQYGWYFQTIILFYIAFILSFIKGKEQGVLRFALFIVLYVTICVALKKPSTWYEASFSMLYGIILCENVSSKSVIRNSLPQFFVLGILTFVAVVMGAIFSEVLIGTLLKLVSAPLFVSWFIMLYQHIKKRCNRAFRHGKVMRYFGLRSFEMYSAQGIVLRCLSARMHNSICIIMLSTTMTVALTELLHMVFKWFDSFCDKKRI